MNTKCFVSDLGISPCVGDPLYRVAVTGIPADAPKDSKLEVFACRSEEHLGHAVAGMSRNGFGLAVWVTRLVAREDPTDVDHAHVMKMREAGAFALPCRVCNSAEHCAADCPTLADDV